MLEVIGWAFFAGCFLAAFVAPIAALIIGGDWIYKRYVEKSTTPK